MLEHLPKHLVGFARFLDYTSTDHIQPLRTGIGPETFAFISPGPNGSFTGGSPPSQAQTDFYNEHGFYITGSDYVLRPEVLESNFYAWRVTGDTKYLDRARAAAQSIQQFCGVNGAFAGINDVNQKNSGFIDDTESFFFAEVMKYLWVNYSYILIV